MRFQRRIAISLKRNDQELPSSASWWQDGHKDLVTLRVPSLADASAQLVSHVCYHMVTIAAAPPNIMSASPRRKGKVRKKESCQVNLSLYIRKMKATQNYIQPDSS